MNTKATPTTAGDKADRPACPLEFYRPEAYKPEESVGYLMRRILSTVSNQVERELEPSGLTNAHWLPLLKLHLKQADTVAELARCVEMDAGAMTRLLDRLEAKGLVRRMRSQSDRRVVNLELTPEGIRAAEKIPVALCDVQNRTLTGFTTEEWRTLKDLLRRVLDNALALQTGSADNTHSNSISKSKETSHEPASAK